MNKKAAYQRNRRWQAKNRPWVKAYMHKWRCKQYGITPEQYAQLLERQGGGCAICGGGPAKGKSLCIDHDHETGKVRGLLCHYCNPGLGNFHDSEALLHRAIAYLRGDHGRA